MVNTKAITADIFTYIPQFTAAFFRFDLAVLIAAASIRWIDPWRESIEF